MSLAMFSVPVHADEVSTITTTNNVVIVTDTSTITVGTTTNNVTVITIKNNQNDRRPQFTVRRPPQQNQEQNQTDNRPRNPEFRRNGPQRDFGGRRRPPEPTAAPSSQTDNSDDLDN